MGAAAIPSLAMMEIMGPAAAASAMGGAGAAGLGAAGLGAAGLGAGAGGAEAGLLGPLYGAAVPGLSMGGQQAAMLAAQTGEFGLPGLMATAGSGGGLAGSSLGQLGNALSTGSKTYSAANKLMGQPQQAQRAPAAMPNVPQATQMQGVPNPMQLRLWAAAQRRQKQRS